VTITTSNISASSVWTQWNYLYYSNAVYPATSGVTSSIWVQWNQAVTSAVTSVSTNTTWVNWNGQYIVGGSNYYPTIQPTADPAAAERAAAWRKRVSQADDRAVRTLLEHLTPLQKEQYAKDKFFEVVSATSRRRYRISHGWAGNITVFDEQDRQVEKLCIHPSKQVPYADNLLAQKLLLEADEEKFLKIANHTPAPALRAA
jgi:hypothetical protein